jgi:hypothetical protein
MGKRNRHHTRIPKAATASESKSQEESERVSKALEMLMELAHKPTPAPARPDRTDIHKELLEHHRQRDIKRRNAILAARTQAPTEAPTEAPTQAPAPTQEPTEAATSTTYQDFCSIQ